VSNIEHWIDGDAPPDVKQWLLAARAEVPPRERVEACAALAAVSGVSLVTAAVAAETSLSTGAAGAAGKPLALALLKWGAGGLLAGGAFAGGVTAVQHAAAPAPSAVSATQARPIVASSAAVRTVSAPEPQSSATVAAPPAPEPERRSVPLPETRTVPEPGASPKPTNAPALDARLAEELALLKRARASLDAGDVRLASLLLEEHEERFGATSPLSPEARYLDFELLLAGKRRAEARALALEILARDPNGPHAERARALLEKE
jgi:hypothetical protein